MSWGRKALLLSVLSVLSAPAQAQTSPGFTTGQTLGATQLNAAFVAKQDWPGPVKNVTAFGAAGDGTTNDFAAIQAALTAAGAAGGGLVTFPCGTFLLGAGGTGLTVSSNTMVAGSGWCTIIKTSASTTTATFGGTSVSNVIIKDLAVDGHSTTTAAPKAFVFTTSNHIRLNNLYVNGGVSLGSSFNNGFASVGSTDMVTTNSTVLDVKNACFDQWAGSTDVAYIGNYCDLTMVPGTTAYGALVTGITTALTAATNSRAKIIGNTIRGAKQVGIWVQGGWNHVSGGGAIFGSTVDAVIADNIIDTVSSFHGINISDAARITVSGNVIRNAQSEGIRINSEDSADGGTVSNVTVVDNMITGCNVAANDACIHIGGGAGATNIKIAGNRTSGSYTNAVFIGASVPGVQITNNMFDQGSAILVSDGGTNTQIVDAYSRIPSSPSGAGGTTHSCLAAANCIGYNLLTINSTLAPASNVAIAAFDVETFQNAGFTGNANGISSQFSIHGTPGDTGHTYVGLQSIAFGQAPGGQGSLFGAGMSALLDGSSTNWNEVVGGEFDVSCFGCVTHFKTGLKIATESTDTAIADTANIGLSFTSNASSSFWDCTLCFGGYAGTWTGDARTTLIGAWANGNARVGSGSAVPLVNAGTAANGADFRNVTFTGFAFASNGFTVDPNGTVAAPFISALKSVIHQPLVFAGLTAIAGSVSYITNGTAANCGDGTCTTFGTTVTAGGAGTLKLLVWYNGTNWTLIGK